ncbi:HD domain-containing phosphohydrolase [uncultured Thiodictyon sp.]|uniref:HD domain-containing phosphohydrolase n=1 Tax=uncultured Thiodictyon sp. TaxID=1846217 RepID=UPI0025F4765D|nr:HD domain-containing phosphohydrolase [uncultured Thiodictyon sp.]
MAHILIIEDDRTQAKVLDQRLVKAGYQVSIGSDGAEGWRLAQTLHPDLIISDIAMPVMDGLQLCRRIRDDEHLRTIPIILLTVMSDVQDLANGLNVGADNYLIKPYDTALLLERVRATLGRPSRVTEETKIALQATIGGTAFEVCTGPQQMLNLLLSTYSHAIFRNQLLHDAQDQLALRNNQLQDDVEKKSTALIEHQRRLNAEQELVLNMETAQLREIHATLIASVTAIAATVETRDPFTAGHQRRVTNLAVMIGRQLALTADELEGLQIAGVVHDVGNIRIPIEILTKPGRLDTEEFAFIKTHPQTGYDILKHIRFPWPISELVVQHHERLDGSGYPHGLTGDRILLGAKILALADVVNAMTSRRPYREPLGLDAAIEEIQTGRAKKYEPAVVDTFMSIHRQGLWAPETA